MVGILSLAACTLPFDSIAVVEPTAAHSSTVTPSPERKERARQEVAEITPRPSAIPTAEPARVTGYALSTIPFRMDLYVARSQAVAVATAVSSTVTWNNSKSAIFTDYTMDVQQYLKGAEPFDRIIVRVPGGKIGQSETVISGGMNFTPGQQYLLFLDRTGGWYELPGPEYFSVSPMNYRIKPGDVAELVGTPSDSRPVADVVRDVQQVMAGTWSTPVPTSTPPPAGSSRP